MSLLRESENIHVHEHRYIPGAGVLHTENMGVAMNMVLSLYKIVD